MGKKDEGTKKYGAPLYCAAWPPGDTCLFAGGGGKRSSGIPNRLVAARASGEQLSDEVAALHTGTDAPLRAALHPAGSPLLLAMGEGGLARVDLARAPGGGLQLTLSDTDTEALRALGSIKALAFSSDGRLLALGGEDCSIRILDWPLLRVRAHLTSEHGIADGIRDIDFSAAHKQRVVATTAENGACQLWDWAHSQQISSLELPPVLGKPAAFSRCRFSRAQRPGEPPGLYVVANIAGAAHVVHYQQNEAGELTAARRCRAASSPVTAFDISAHGSYLAVGSSEGEIVVLSTAKLAPVRRIRNGHMIFITALAFSPDEKMVLTVSADASARTTQVVQTSGFRVAAARALRRAAALLLALLMLLLAVVAQRIYERRASLTWRNSAELLPDWAWLVIQRLFGWPAAVGPV